MSIQQIISLEEARDQGLKRYFTGKPCKNGHISERITSGRSCCECNRLDYEQNREKKLLVEKERYEKNKEKRLAQAKLYHSKNREARTAYNREYRVANAKSIADQKRRYVEENREAVALRQKQKRLRKIDEYKARDKLYFEKNKDRILKRGKEYYAANREARARYWADYYESTREYHAERNLAYRDRRPDVFAALSIKRRRALEKAIPSFYGELDEFVLQEAYSLAKIRESVFGAPFHVDHMIPLRSKQASGLHCAYNVAVIPYFLNLRKHNKMLYTTPGSWIADA